MIMIMIIIIIVVSAASSLVKSMATLSIYVFVIGSEKTTLMVHGCIIE